MMESPLLNCDSKYVPPTCISGYRIAKEVIPGEHSCQYCAQVKHLQDYWYCHFVITKDLGMCLTVQTYKEHNIFILVVFLMCLYFR